MPARPRSIRRRVSVLVATVGAALGVALMPSPAAAAPGDPSDQGPQTSAEAAELLASRGHDLEVVTEQFNEARDALATQQAAAADAATAADQAEAAVTAARDTVRGVARSAWTGESLGSLQALLTSSSADDFVDRVGVLDMVADHQNGLLTEAIGTSDAADAARVTANDAAAQAQTSYDAVAAQQSALEAQIAEYQADFARLSASERAAALAAAEEAARQQQEAATRAAREEAAAESSSSSSSGHSSRESSEGSPAPAPAAAPASGVAQTVIATAMAQRGKPYVWAAAGPGSFDCSGFTQYAFRSAGISLPHSSRGQSTMGQAVSRANLQPGDLVFFYSPVSHVGIYIGSGQMVHAPTSGDVVKVSSIDAMGGYAGARRIG